MARLTRDLDRLAQVFEINDHMIQLRTPREELEAIEDFASTAHGAAALRGRLRLPVEDLVAASALPADTLGGAFGASMRARGLSIDAIRRLQPRDDIEYIVAHYYDTHDLWHVLTGFDTSAAGEVGLQAFYLAQGRAYLPLLVISAVLMNTALFEYEDRHARLDAIARGWTLGKEAQRIAGIDWRQHLASPLAEVQREFGLAS